MKISNLIKRLQQIKKCEGDIEVTCTASDRMDDANALPEVWESTVENFQLLDGGSIGKRVRLYL